MSASGGQARSEPALLAGARRIGGPQKLGAVATPDHRFLVRGEGMCAGAQAQQPCQGMDGSSHLALWNRARGLFPPPSEARKRIQVPGAGRRRVLEKKPRMRIGEILIREGHLTQDGLEEALDWQVLYGGRLGTNLLELKLVEEEPLARALARQLGCEVAWGELQPEHEVIPLLPKHVADHDEMVPWKMEKRRLKVLCTEIHLEKMDQLAYKVGRACLPVIAPEFRVFQLLRANYGATRQMRALDFGVVPTEGRRRKKKQESGPAQSSAELIDEAAFNDLYNRVVQGRPTPPRGMAPVAPPGQAAAPSTPVLETLPEDAILGEVPEPAAAPVGPPPGAASWEEPAAQAKPKVDDAPQFRNARSS